MNQSELLQSKVIDAHAMLWERIVRIGHNVPRPYNGVLGLFSLLFSHRVRSGEEESRAPVLNGR